MKVRLGYAYSPCDFNPFSELDGFQYELSKETIDRIDKANDIVANNDFITCVDIHCDDIRCKTNIEADIWRYRVFSDGCMILYVQGKYDCTLNAEFDIEE